MRLRKPVEKVLRMLRMDLEGWSFMPMARKAVTITPPSLVTPLTYAGVPLWELARPPGHLTPLTLAQGFDRLVLDLQGQGDGKPPLPGVAPGAAQFIGKNLARLMFVAGQQKGYELEADLDANRMVVVGEYTYGVSGNSVYGLNLNTELDNLNLQSLLEPVTMTTRDSGFIALYSRAKALKKPLAMRALEMLVAYRSTSLIRIAPWIKRPLSNHNSETMAEIVYTTQDPIAELYLRLVPCKFSPTEFQDLFGRLEARDPNPGLDARKIIWRKLFD